MGKKRAHEEVSWAEENLSCDRATIDVKASQVNSSRFIIVNIKMMTKSMISRNSHICLQFPVYNCIHSSVIITEISRFT